MDELFGVRTDGLLEDGYLQPPHAPHPITGGLGRETHIFGGSRVSATRGTVLAQVEPQQPPLQSEGAMLDAIVAHQSGRGRTILFAPDLITSVLHIHQGKTVKPLPPRESAGAPAASILDPDRDGDLIRIDDIDDLYYSGAESDQEGRTQYNRPRLAVANGGRPARAAPARHLSPAQQRRRDPARPLVLAPRALFDCPHVPRFRRKPRKPRLDSLRPPAGARRPSDLVYDARARLPPRILRHTHPVHLRNRPPLRHRQRAAARGPPLEPDGLRLAARRALLRDRPHRHRLQQEPRPRLAGPPRVLPLVPGQRHPD